PKIQVIMTKTAFCSRGYKISYNPAYLPRHVLTDKLGKLAIAHRVQTFAFRDISAECLLLMVGKSSPSGHWPTGLAILDILGVDCVTEIAVTDPLDLEDDDDDGHGDT